MNYLQIALKHKVIFFIAVIVIASGGYYAYGKINPTKTQTQYITQNISKGTLTVSISGTGQMVSDNQVEIKPEASGKILSLRIQNGQAVKTGETLAQIDATDALKTLRDAQNNLESAQLSLEKLKAPAGTLTLLQAENSLEKAKESKQTSLNDLDKSYEDGFNNISNAFLDLPSLVSGLQSILYNVEKSLNSGRSNVDYYADVIAQYNQVQADAFKKDAIDKFAAARNAYDSTFIDYKTVTRFSSKETIENLLVKTYETTKKISEAIKSTNNLIQLYTDKLSEKNISPINLSLTHLSSLNGFTGQANSHLSSLLSSQNSIADNKQGIVNSERSIKESQENLIKLKAGTDALDIKSAELTLKQRQDALADTKNNLSKYTIRSPFDGTIAKLSVKKSDSVSSGSSIATLVAKQQLAEISLNEVDVAKIKVNQKATLNFEAIDGLTLTGTVAEIDTLGTTAQGVVSYMVKIALDTQNSVIKPGMSVSASIITDVRQDVILAPNAAIKIQSNDSYAEILENGIAKRIIVETGLTNDAFSEITSGLIEGQEVITQTINAATKSQTQTNSILPIGGGAFRAAGGR